MILHNRIPLILFICAVFNSLKATAEITSCHATPEVIHRKITRTYKGAGIWVEYPQIAGETAFNRAVLAEVRSRVKGVEQEADIEAKYPPPTGRHSSVGSTLSVSGTRTGTVSVLFSFGLDASTAVHPWEELTSFNYDLCNHRLLRLDDVFVPNARYLPTLSKLSIKALESREYGYPPQIRSGAAPRSKNFNTFTLDDEGLTIHFQQYQVAAGAAGSTLVKIPWKELKQILRKRYRELD